MDEYEKLKEQARILSILNKEINWDELFEKLDNNFEKMKENYEKN